MTHDDAKLLRDFASGGSESAFSEIVRRNLDFVYSTALRQVHHDSLLAADVSQSVFVDLARKASSLRPDILLAGWLHRATSLASLAAVRSESRRRAREMECAVMQKENQADLVPDWEALQPVIDDALGELNDQDREAVLMRFFRRQSFREVGGALGVSENAARMRVDRALEKLRPLLAKRGVTSGASALGVALTAGTFASAPAALSAAVTAAAVSAVTVNTISIFGILKLMTSLKTKLAVTAALTAAVATPLIIQHNANSRLQTEIQALKLQSAELERLRLENAELAGLRVDADEMARLRSQQRELFRLRGQVALLREENARLDAEKAKMSIETATRTPEPPVDFISADSWMEVGTDTPENAFQSFLAVLQAGDPQQIASTVHWDVQWKEDMTEEDEQLVEKSIQDYVDMLQRAPERMSAFRLSSVTDASSDRKRVAFSTLTSDGAQIDSNFDMVLAQDEWKPVLRMGWRTFENQTVFATSPVFGPEIDL